MVEVDDHDRRRDGDDSGLAFLQDRVGILVKAFEQGMKTPAFQALMQQQGLESQVKTGAEFQKYLDQEDARWRSIIKTK